MNFIYISSFVFVLYLYDFFVKYLNISFIDELFTIISFLIALYIKPMFKMTFSLPERKIIYSILALILIGILGAFIFKFQPINIILMDILIFAKFFITYFSLRVIFTYRKFNLMLTNNIIYFLYFLFSILFILVLWNSVFPLFPHFDYKYFSIGSEEIFFGHPAKFAYIIQIILILLFPAYKYIKNFLFVSLPIILLGMMSFRTKYFAFITLYLIGLSLIKVFKIRKFSFTKLMLILLFIIPIIGFIAFDSIQYHIANNNDASQGVRGLLLFSATDIAFKYFPLGSGFGSFGSYASTVNYSSLYYDYGFDKIVGCMPEQPSFLVDSFYGMVIAQFGLLGTLLFGYIFYLYFKILFIAYNHDQENKYYYLGMLILLLTVLLDGFSATILTQNIGVFIAVYLAAVITKYELSKKHKS